MTRQLVFTVCAPYGAWGAASASSATTAYKATELDPSRSALIGLLGAALGLPRERLGALSDALFLAVRVGARPERDPKPDYHTITRAVPPKGRHRWSRFEEARGHLAGVEDSGSILSRREYWAGGLWSIAMASGTSSEWSVDMLEEALSSPRWVLYAGRKACTLGLPPDPEIHEAVGPVVALAAYGWPWQRRPALAQPLEPLRRRVDAAAASAELLFDPGYPDAPTGDEEAIRYFRRRDLARPLPLPDGRVYPRFQERTEARIRWRPPA